MTTNNINTNPTMAEMLAQLEALRKENANLLASSKRAPHGPTIKVSPKGAISVYGLGRWPLTLYASQWNRLLKTYAKDLDAFLNDPQNIPLFSIKEDAKSDASTQTA